MKPKQASKHAISSKPRETHDERIGKGARMGDGVGRMGAVDLRESFGPIT